MKDNKKIYISGKITGLAHETAYANFELAEKVLESLGYEPINPMKKVSEQEGKTYKEYMLEDIELLWDCAGIFMLDNWKDSRGARIERFIAEELGLEVMGAIT